MLSPTKGIQGKNSSYCFVGAMGAKDRLRKERPTAAQLAQAAAEGYERGQADAKASVEAAQAEAAAREETLGATTRALKVALGKLQ